MYLEIARRLEVLLADLEAQPQHGRLQPVLVDDCEDVLLECGLEEGGLAEDLAAEAPRRVQVHATQQDVRLRRLTTLQD